MPFLLVSFVGLPRDLWLLLPSMWHMYLPGQPAI